MMFNNKKVMLGGAISVALVSGISQIAPNYKTAEAVTLPAIAPATPLAAPAATESLQNLFVNISDKMIPSVVNIFTSKNIRPQGRGYRTLPPGFQYDPWAELFGQHFGGMPPGGMGGAMGPTDNEVPGAQSAARPHALGTGFIVEVSSGRGLILTNHHVIAGADDVKVKLTENEDEAEIPAKVIGKDPELDIALLEVKTTKPLKAAALGDSEKLKVGEWVAAIGNPFGHGHSVSHGIVSAKARALPGGFGKYLQTDTPINPGNSGGPLVNLAGEVIGINNAIDARGPGIGFAIPINSVKELLGQLKSDGRVDRGFLGVQIMPLKPELARALKAQAAPGTPVVTDVVPDQPAAKAGLEAYDIISKINGKTVKSPEELTQTILQVPVGKSISTEVIRGGKHMTFEVKIGKRPEPKRS